MDIRDAILELLKVVRDGNRKLTKEEERTREVNQDILEKLEDSSSSSSSSSSVAGMNKKIDNISTFLLRMNAKLESIERRVKRGGRGGGGGDLLETLAQESFDILTLLPTYIEGAKDAVNKHAKDTRVGEGLLLLLLLLLLMFIMMMMMMLLLLLLLLLLFIMMMILLLLLLLLQ